MGTDRAAHSGTDAMPEVVVDDPSRTRGYSDDADSEDDTAGSSLVRAGRGMAIGTLASRVTGFFRVLVMAAALGLGSQLLDSYNVANSIPNAVYDLVFGAAAASLVVPLVSRASIKDADGGVAFAQRLLSLATYGLTAVVVLTVLLAPLLVDLYTPGFARQEHDVAVVFARFFLPQILFYGVGAAAGAVLNTRGRFAVPAWATAANNLIVVGVGVGYLAIGGSNRLETLTRPQLLLLALGTTAGVVGQMGLVLWALRRSGFPMRLRLDLRGMGLRQIARLGIWVILSVIANQALLAVTTRLASTGGPGSVSAYQTAYGLFHVPYAVVAVSVMTAMLPALSRSASRHDTGQIIADLSRGLRLVLVITAPIAAVMCALGPQISTALFAHGNSTASAVSLVGTTMSVFGLALVPFAGFSMLMAGFYAMQDTRTSALVTSLVGIIGIAGCLVSARLVHGSDVVIGLPIAYTVAYTVGLITVAVVLRRRLGRIDGRRLLKTHIRVGVGALTTGVAAAATGRGMAYLVGTAWTGSAVALVAAGLVAASVYVVAARVLRITELTQLVAVFVEARRSSDGAAAH